MASISKEADARHGQFYCYRQTPHVYDGEGLGILKAEASTNRVDHVLIHLRNRLHVSQEWILSHSCCSTASHSTLPPRKGLLARRIPWDKIRRRPTRAALSSGHRKGSNVTSSTVGKHGRKVPAGLASFRREIGVAIGLRRAVGKPSGASAKARRDHYVAYESFGLTWLIRGAGPLRASMFPCPACGKQTEMAGIWLASTPVGNRDNEITSYESITCARSSMDRAADF